MTEQRQKHPSGASAREPAQSDATFKRHGPPPPENDSGPSPSVEDAGREGEDAGHGIAKRGERGRTTPSQ